MPIEKEIEIWWEWDEENTAWKAKQEGTPEISLDETREMERPESGDEDACQPKSI